ncbi:MAG: acyl-CoA reductase [Ferruginibacter sp.]
MILQQRIDLMVELGKYMDSDDLEWEAIKNKAFQHNPWFIREFINTASKNITKEFLQFHLLNHWAAHYHLDNNIDQKNIGIVMAGNIPLVGFHDFLTAFICGHRQTIKLSSKDDVLIPHLVNKLYSIDAETQTLITFSEMLKNCDAYIATGSNNSSRYFEHYFSKYPNIIRRNKTSVAFLSGKETIQELENLSDDIHIYFGFGCRNITKLFVPEGYDFIPLLNSFNKYSFFKDHHKYNNNYDYQLSVMLMNNIYYMTNGSTLIVENSSPFSAISVINYEKYRFKQAIQEINSSNDIQSISGKGYVPFGQAQSPGLFMYADNRDTMEFLLTL